MTQMAIYDRIRARTKEHFGVSTQSSLVSRRSGNDNGDRRSSECAPRCGAARTSHLHDDRKVLPAGASPGSSSRLCRRPSWRGWRSMNDFHMPAPEFDELIRDQKLDDLQAYELRLVLYHVDEDLKEYRKRREGNKPRRELVRRLKRFRGFVRTILSTKSIVRGKRWLTSCHSMRRRKLGCSCPTALLRLRSTGRFPAAT